MESAEVAFVALCFSAAPGGPLVLLGLAGQQLSQRWDSSSSQSDPGGSVHITQSRAVTAMTGALMIRGSLDASLCYFLPSAQKGCVD